MQSESLKGKKMKAYTQVFLGENGGISGVYILTGTIL